ncbi:CoA-binding protein [Rhodohalobacter sp. SW132]|uniref:CoA-binding protein n=1 Tax=Rhodohalobacter sp. SW132 TaxID=2293433 RepID=UPI0018F6BBBF|nr:CoA-binding protein [Rhodohalobacter sp. SW132]
MRSTFNSWYEKKMRATPELSEETDTIENWLDNIKTIAIVGISRNRYKDSHFVGRYLQNAGYNIIPVNPGADEILGNKAYPDLKSIPETVDAVDVFISPDYVPEVVNQALEIDPKVIWLQLGTGDHPDEKQKAEEAGTLLVQNRCMKVDHQFLIRDRDKGK